MISIEHIRKKFCNRLVVDDVSLVLEKENVHAFIGSSGSGKTTLLKMIAGILEPDEGLVKIDDEVMTTKSQMHLSRLMGYVMQDGGLFPHFTAKGNVSLQARVLNWSLDKIEQRMSELSSMFNIDSHILEQYPSQLSGGQKQRIAVMRGLFLDPNILLLDEPLGALDPLIRANLQEELKKIFQKLKKLVILVTHDLAEATYFSDTISLFHEGRLIQHGQFSDLERNPSSSFVTNFMTAQQSIHQLGAR